MTYDVKLRNNSFNEKMATFTYIQWRSNKCISKRASAMGYRVKRHRGGGVGMTLQYSGPNIVRIGGDGLDMQVGYDGVSNSMVAELSTCLWIDMNFWILHSDWLIFYDN